MKAKIIVFLLIISVAILSFGCSSDDHEGEAKTPSASSVQKGRDYQRVIEDFEEHGFTNIITDPQDDLITGWITKEGEVEKVSVDGDENYSSDTWYPEDVEVIITYHTFPEAEDEEAIEEDEHIEEAQPTEDTESVQEKDLAKETEPDEEESEEVPEDDEDAEIREKYGISINDIDWKVDWMTTRYNGDTVALYYTNKSDKTITDLYFTFCQKDNLTGEEAAAIDELYEDHIGVWKGKDIDKNDIGAVCDVSDEVAPGQRSDLVERSNSWESSADNSPHPATVDAADTSFILTSMDQYNAMQPEKVKITYRQGGGEKTVSYNFLTDTYSTEND